MTRDLILSSVISLGLHAVLILSDTRSNGGVKPTQEPQDKKEIQLTSMPVEPDEIEVVERDDAEKRPIELSPPMQPDRVEAVRPDTFVQKVQPPPPEGVVINASLTAVPVTRDAGAFNRIKVFDPAMLDQVPVPKFQARPQYPFDMRRQGISGEVVVDFIVDTNGVVQNAFALRSSQREFEAAAVLAVTKWKFRPGRKDGRDVPTHMQVPIIFSLNEG